MYVQLQGHLQGWPADRTQMAPAEMACFWSMWSLILQEASSRWFMEHLGNFPRQQAQEFNSFHCVLFVKQAPSSAQIQAVGKQTSHLIERISKPHCKGMLIQDRNNCIHLHNQYTTSLNIRLSQDLWFKKKMGFFPFWWVHVLCVNFSLCTYGEKKKWWSEIYRRCICSS